jgi:hypothetical protein
VFLYQEKSRFDNTITYFGTAEGALTIPPDFGQLGIERLLYKIILISSIKNSLTIMLPI